MSSSPNTSSSISSTSSTIMSSSSSTSSLLHSVFSVSNIKNHVSIVLNFTNFLLWQTLFVNILKCHQIQDHVDPLATPPSPMISTNADDVSQTQPNPCFLLWQQIDYVIISWLHATISPEILNHVLQPGKQMSALQTWQEIENLFHDHVNAKYLQLKLAFNQATKGNRSMTEFLQTIKSTVDALYSIGKPVADDDVILQVLSGLSSEYSDVITVMTARTPLPTFLELRSFLLAHESRLQIDSSKSTSDPQVLLTTRTHGGFSSRGNFRGGNSFRGGRSNHYRNGSGGYSRPFNRGGFPASQNSRSNGSFSGRHYNSTGRSFGQSASSSSILGAPPSACQICDSHSHIAKSCPYRLSNGSDLVGSFAGIHLHDPSWQTDTGASHHMTNDLDVLDSYKPYTGHDTVKVGDGAKLSISHIGSSNTEGSSSLQ